MLFHFDYVFVALYTAVAIAGPPSMAGNSSEILALRASALPALVAVPLLDPVLRRLLAPLRTVLAFYEAMRASEPPS